VEELKHVLQGAKQLEMSEDTGSAHTDERVSWEAVDVDLLEFRGGARSHLPLRDALILVEDTERAGSNVL